MTANQPFSEWGSIFPDQAMTLAAADRLVHRATIFELNVESYRRRAAVASTRAKRVLILIDAPPETPLPLPVRRRRRFAIVEYRTRDSRSPPGSS